MLIGYARVSTLDQTLALQQDALSAAGCEQLYTDTVSGSVTERPGLTQALSHLRPGDTLVVWRLDRLGRSLPHLIETISKLQQQGIGFCSLQEQINTSTSGGKLVFHVFGALAEFERDLIRERTHAGLKVIKGGCYRNGPNSSPVLARKPRRSPGRYCIRFRRPFTRAVSSARVCLVRLASDRFRCDHTSSTGLSSWA